MYDLNEKKRVASTIRTVLIIGFSLKMIHFSILGSIIVSKNRFELIRYMSSQFKAEFMFICYCKGINAKTFDFNLR